MKKKILLVLLVVLMVGILAFSVFACNGGGDDKKDNNNKKPVDPDDDGEEEALEVNGADMFNALFDSIDNTAKVVLDMKENGKANASATIYVDVASEDKAGVKTNVNVELNISGSVDKSTTGNSWALVEIKAQGTELALYAVDKGTAGEYLYLGQNALDEEFTWSKLSQVKDANLLTTYAIDNLFKLVESINADTAEKLEAGILTNLKIGTFGLDLVKNLGGTIGKLLFLPVDGKTENLATDDGYGAILNLANLTSVINTVTSLPGLGDIDTSGIAPYQDIIDMVVPILFGEGSELSFENGIAFKAGDEIPEIKLLLDVNADETFGGIHLGYKTADEKLSVAFGIDNVKFEANTASSPVDTAVAGADDLAIALKANLDLPGVSAQPVAATIEIQPNVALTFDEDGYVALDLTKLQAVATAKVGTTDYVVAEYNLDGQEDIYIDLTAVATAVGADLDASELKYKVPVNANEKFAGFIQGLKDEKAAEAQNAGNIVDSVYGAIAGMFDAEGKFAFNLDAIMGLDFGGIIEAVTSLGAYVEAVENVVTIDVEALINALIAPNGIIGGIEGEWNSFGLYDAEGTKTNSTLAELMAKDKVIGNIAGLINSMTYDNYLATVVEEDAAENVDVATLEEEVIPVMRGEVVIYPVGNGTYVYNKDVDAWNCAMNISYVADYDCEVTVSISDATTATIGRMERGGMFGLNAIEDWSVIERTTATYALKAGEELVVEVANTTDEAETINLAVAVRAYTYEEVVGEGITAADINGLVADVLGSGLDLTNAYKNMELVLSGKSQDGLSATVGATINEAEVSLGLGFDIVASRTIPATMTWDSADDAVTVCGGVDYSNNTGNDGANKLVNTLKKLFNAVITAEKFELDAVEEIVADPINVSTLESVEIGYDTWAIVTEAGLYTADYNSAAFMYTATEACTVTVTIHNYVPYENWVGGSTFTTYTYDATNVDTPISWVEDTSDVDSFSVEVAAGETLVLSVMDGGNNVIVFDIAIA